MKESVALLVAARAELATHDDHEVVVSILCRRFDVTAEDAQGAVLAAQLLASQPGRDEHIRPVAANPDNRRFVPDASPCIAAQRGNG